jgi:hypothetical protein
MADNSRERDIVLGRNLAETQVLNSPEYVAGTEAAAAVKRATAARSQTPAANRRRFRRALLAMLVVMALVGVSAWLYGSH